LFRRDRRKTSYTGRKKRAGKIAKPIGEGEEEIART